MQSNNQPTVSVIIIVFNGAKYILDAIESVFNQTFKDFEIVVVDDGSTDNTKAVLGTLIKEGKIRYFYQQNKGTSGAYNTGVRLAKGKYIKFLDCDDFLYPQQLELQVKHLQGKPETLISVTDFEFEFEGSVKKNGKLRLDKDNQLAQFIQGNPCPGHTILASRRLIEQAGGFDESLVNQEDTDLWVRILLQGGVFEKLDYTGCCYRILGGSVSSNPEKVFRDNCKFYEKLNSMLLPGIRQLQDKVLRRLFLSNIKLVHTSFARKIDPDSCLAVTLQVGNIIYGLKMGRIRRLLLKSIGFKNIAVLKYLKACVTGRDYRVGLLGTSWREESAHV